MERLVSDVADLGAQQLQVSSMPSFASRWIAPRLGGFLSANPGIQVRIAGGDARSDFDRDGIDVGLRYRDGDYPRPPSPTFSFARDRPSPVCSPALAINWPRSRRHSRARAAPRGRVSSLVAPGLPTWPRLVRPRLRASTAATAARSLVRQQPHGACRGCGGSGLRTRDQPPGRRRSGRRPLGAAISLTALESSFGFWFVCREDRIAEPKIAAFRAWLLSLSTARGARAGS